MKKGWQTKKLGDVCDFIGGSQPPKAVFLKVQTPDSIRLIQIRDYKSDNHVVYIPKAQARRFCAADDIMIGRYGPPIFQILRGLEGAYNVALMKAVPDETQVYREFLFYFLKQPALLEYVIYHSERAAGQIGVTKETLAPYPITVPPLAEQQRIVGLLDEAFEGLATAKANAEKNLQNARALFESHLQSVFTQRGPGWVEKPLETVSSILNGYAFKSSDFSGKEGTKCIKITNVGVREFVSNADGYLPEGFAAEYDKVSVKEGSIVLALTRTIIAGGLKVAVVPGEYDGALLNQRVASIIANEKELKGAFLFAYLSTQTVVDYVKERVNTLMQPNLSISDLRGMPIPTPPLREQNKITQQLDSLRAETQRLARLYERKLAALEALKKSLLHQAFTGEL
jgi:type I restriction enzyme S subunit